jgi:hypothetical protein
MDESRQNPSKRLVAREIGFPIVELKASAVIREMENARFHQRTQSCGCVLEHVHGRLPVQLGVARDESGFAK